MYKTNNKTNHQALQTGPKPIDLSLLQNIAVFRSKCFWTDDISRDGTISQTGYIAPYITEMHTKRHETTFKLHMMTNRFKRVHLIFKISCQRGMGSLRESDFSSAKMELKKSWISDFVCKLLMFPWEVFLGQDNLGIDVTFCC